MTSSSFVCPQLPIIPLSIHSYSGTRLITSCLFLYVRWASRAFIRSFIFVMTTVPPRYALSFLSSRAHVPNLPSATTSRPYLTSLTSLTPLSPYHLSRRRTHYNHCILIFSKFLNVNILLSINRPTQFCTQLSSLASRRPLLMLLVMHFLKHIDVSAWMPVLGWRCVSQSRITRAKGEAEKAEEWKVHNGREDCMIDGGESTIDDR